MQPESDAQLLRRYAECGAETAFTELVRRHTNLVYSAALRQVDSSDAAAEIAQSVFIGLARDAQSLSPRIGPDASLAGWLCRSARNLSLNFRRDEFRRQTRERQAMEQLTSLPESAPDWERLRRVLDEAMSQLSESDYDALVLRFFQNQDFRSVGVALGMSDDTAQKRVGRALEKLRGLLSQRGVTTTAAALSVAIAANAVQAAPVGLAITISTAATLAGTTLTTTAAATATKAIVMTTLQKTLVTVTVAVLAGAGIYEAQQASQLRRQVLALEQQQSPVAEQARQLSEALGEATNQVAALRADNERLNRNTGELLRLRGMAGVARRAIDETEQLRAQLTRQASEPVDNPISEAMADARKHALEQRAEGRLSRMTSSLNLTPEQAQAARDILMGQAQAMSAGMQQVYSGKYDKDKLAKLRQDAGNVEEQIKALLTPDQQAGYQTYQQAEAARNASLAANNELRRMQSSLDLAPEQLDGVYAALYEVSFNQAIASTAPSTGDMTGAAEAMQGDMDQKTKALESVLTPAQLDKYRQQQAIQSKLLKDIMSKMEGSAGPK